MGDSQFLQGNVIDKLRGLESESVHAVITSPPYWGLRDYSTQPQIWLNGHEPCAEHEWATAPFPFDTRGNPHGVAGSTLRDGNVSANEAWAKKNRTCADGDHEWVEHLQPSANGQTTHAMVAETLNETSATRKPKRSDFCAKCGAWRGQLGLEPTPEMFVEHIVIIFREVRRVLRDDGVLWLNLGDSYWGGKGQSAHGDPERHIKRLAEGKTINRPYQEIGAPGCTKPGDGKHESIKPKDLAMIPARVALALQADGWYLRSVCPWVKRNGMPESVRDRPTTSHEYWFMLTKSPRYFWDAEAVRVRGSLDSHGGGNPLSHQKRKITIANGGGAHHSGLVVGIPAREAGRNRRTSDAFIESLDGLIDETRAYLAHLERVKQGNAPLLDEDGDLLVLYYSTQSFRDAHFATFSERMITPLVLGSTSERGVCPKCGAPWARVTEQRGFSYRDGGDSPDRWVSVRADVPGAEVSPSSIFRTGQIKNRTTTGWRPTCACIRERAPQQGMRGDDLLELADEVTREYKPVPATILDPFGGAGTTQLVALKHGRNAIYIDLKPEYAEMARQRIAEALGAMELA